MESQERMIRCQYITAIILQAKQSVFKRQRGKRKLNLRGCTKTSIQVSNRRERDETVKAVLIIGMSLIGVIEVLVMKKIAPNDKVYPVWALFIVILFALVVIFS